MARDGRERIKKSVLLVMIVVEKQRERSDKNEGQHCTYLTEVSFHTRKPKIEHFD